MARLGLNDLLGPAWTVYKVSPLFGFHTEPNALQKYGEDLTEFVRHEVAADVSGSWGVIAACALLDCQGRTTEADSDSIVIFASLRSTQAAATTDKKAQSKKFTTLILSGFGLPQQNASSRIMRGLEADSNSQFTYFPVMLAKGNHSNFTDLLITWLQRRFDCHVSQFPILPSELYSFVTQWAYAPSWSSNQSNAINNRDEENEGVPPLQLTYTVPSHIAGLRHITLTVPWDSLKQILDAMVAARKQHGDETEPLPLIQALHTHFAKTFCIVIDALMLTRVSTPSVCVGTDSQLRLFSPVSACGVLRHFAAIALS